MKRIKLRRDRHIVAVNRKLNGRSFRPSPDPKSFVSTPWQPLVFQFSFRSNGISDLLMGHIYSYALKHHFGTDNHAGYIRFESVKIWNTSRKSFACALKSLSLNRLVEVMLEDAPGRYDYARVGYVWPVSHRNISLDTTQHRNEVFATIQNFEVADYIFHFRVLIRSRGSFQIPKLLQTV